MKKRYRQFCQSERSIPIFSRDWWLDAACGEENWDVCCVERGNEIVASMPYCINVRYGLTFLHHPPLTQILGPWLQKTNAQSGTVLAREKELMQMLIDQLPRFASFSQSWHHSCKNWLPFFWNGFSQTTRYTYILPDLSEIDAIWNGMLGNVRRDIRKARDRYNLVVRDDLPFDRFLALNELTFRRQGLKRPYSEDLALRLFEASSARRCCRSFIAVDEAERAHAGAFIVWDENSAYYLLGGADPDLRNSGAGSLCLWEAIQYASTVTRAFDFEGSMIEPIEKAFRAFGATQTPFFRVTKTDSRFLMLHRMIRSFLR